MTIECFMEDIVPRTFEKLYNNKKVMKEISRKELLKFYEELWRD